MPTVIVHILIELSPRLLTFTATLDVKDDIPNAAHALVEGLTDDALAKLRELRERSAHGPPKTTVTIKVVAGTLRRTFTGTEFGIHRTTLARGLVQRLANDAIAWLLDVQRDSSARANQRR